MGLAMGIDTIIGLIVIAGGSISGYAVLKKRVADLEENDNLTEKEHDKLCKISKFEMKEHVTETIVDFDSTKFQPAIKEILREIKNGRS